MRLRASIVCIAVFLAAFSASGDEKKCSASARECESQIRQMLAGRRYLGVTFIDLNPGLGVKSVAGGGPAERAGIREGDRILAINDRWTREATVREFKQQMMARVLSAGKVALLVQRGSLVRRVEVRLEPYTKAQIDKIVTSHLSYSHSDSPPAQP